MLFDEKTFCFKCGAKYIFHIYFNSDKLQSFFFEYLQDLNDNQARDVLFCDALTLLLNGKNVVL